MEAVSGEVLTAYWQRSIDEVVIGLGVCDGEDAIKMAGKIWEPMEQDAWEMLNATGAYHVLDLRWRRVGQ